jgi:predicted DNA-binding protein
MTEGNRILRRAAPVEAPAVPEYSGNMSIELPSSVEEQLRNLAAKQGRDVRTLVEEAVQQYLESAAITDLAPTQVAEAQAALLGELPDVSN